MNKENLQRMADHIRTVPQEMFHMRCYRGIIKDDELIDASDCFSAVECETLGCIIGHSLVLAPELVVKNEKGVIQYADWSEEFTGIVWASSEWYWCFSFDWEYLDNTPEGAALRIEWLINHGLPKNSGIQMIGNAPLCYLPQPSQA